MSGLLVGLALFIHQAARAQPGDDPPAVVARVGEVIGDAWLFDSETREWTRLMRNQTIGEGDQLRTDDRSRVALRIGSTSVWVDERSDLNLRRLDEGRMVLQLDRGDLGLRLRSNEVVGDTRVQTSDGDMLPEREGLYRVEQLDDNRGSRAYVWQGRLRFEPARGGDIPPTVLQSGEQAEFWWAGGPRVERNRLSSDGFGDWMVAEDRRESDGIAVARRYVSPEMTGIEDLDRNGRWEQSSDYGAIWYPTAVGSDWAPYRDGHWVWTRAWGWTWVDDAPWGFAPFHYGRWVQYRGRWCWAPGAYVQRPVYAPALVAWVGGGNWSVSIGAGRNAPPRYGWYPLAPREVYVPPFRHSPVYERRVNADHGPMQG
ncbi:DUF6600 domain-containing protein, partial [Pelomonas sp. KK5]|uniref:DUF6600 domain-containing protein n=1 Tax=Pelomonas sp. KK5 TaxID=1855730 RepID=UPI00351458B6